MYDSTGVGWNAHMGFGTSVLLEALGPASFCEPQSLAIYREIRLFEISRAALFQQSTILASDRWLVFDQTCRIAGGGGSSALEAAFDMFLRIVALHQRFVTNYSSSISTGISNDDTNSTERFNKNSHQPQTTPSPPPPKVSTPNSPTSPTPSPPPPQSPQQTSPASTTTPCPSISPA
jgi:hypothetical protein